MASYLCCWRNCSRVLDLVISPSTVPIQQLPLVALDTNHAGQEVVVVKNGTRICGTGGVLGSAPIMQDKSYFEIRVQQTGVWGLGLANEKADLNVVPMGGNIDSWVLCHDGCLRHNNEELHHITPLPQEGDIIGVTYNHVELNFFLNGQKLDCPFTNVKGKVFPALYVDQGAVLDVVFEHFSFDPPNGYDKIMLEQSLLET